ncbi:MAG TPA: alpha/beta hydrolase-fold protein [Bacteroidales bacterium]|nr:alpha/beta hydrolase-fold protein [Bacteroidales bacterium]
MKNKSFFPFILLLIVSLAAGTLNNASAQKLKAGPQDLSFFSSVDETDQPYAIYIPKNFDENRKYPLVIFLHGAMSNHRLGLRRAFGQGNIQGPDFIKPGHVPAETDLEVTRYWPKLKDVDYIVAAPYARGTAGYQGIPEQDVYDVLADVKSRFNIDEDRIYLTGLSMGGGGTLWLGMTRPDIWAAIAPCCPAPPDGTIDLSGNAHNLPVHLFIGDKDFLYKTAQDWRAKLANDAKLFDYVEYPGIGHNSWEYAYKDGFIFDWFAQFVRNPYPEEVKFSSTLFKYDKAYWVTLDDLIPGTLATIDAVFKDRNNIEVNSKGLEAFTLNLEGHPMFDRANKVTVTVDGKTFTVKTPDAVSFSKLKGNWVNRKFTPGLMSKQKGAEGPMSAVISSNHIYVYGTGGEPSKEELAERRAEASKAADWAFDRGMMGRIMVFPRVLSDKELRQSDYDNSNLVLFGTRETNAVIDKFADRLPLELKNNAKDYGLVYVFPLNNHYVLINSGLVWWTPPKKAQQQQGFAFMGAVTDALRNMKDFILFKEGPDNIVTQGYFDNNWKLPEDAASAMKSTGVITIK